MFFLLACSTPVQPADGLAVLGITPSHGQVDVPIDADVTVVFSQPLDSSTADAVELYGDDTPLDVTVTTTGSVITVRPADLLETDAAYTVVLGSSIATQGGEMLGTPVSATFTTGDGLAIDPDQDVPVAPPKMSLRTSVTVDDGLSGYSVDGAWTDPFVNIAFFDDDPEDACQWYGWLTDAGPAVFPEATSVWVAHQVSLESFDTDCAAFDAETWGADTPNDHMDGVSMAVGWGPMSAEAAGNVREHLEGTGEDWSTYAPYVHSVWYAFQDDTGAWEAYEVGYGIAHAVDDAGELMEDAEGNPVWLESGETAPGAAVYVGYHHQPLSTGLLF